MVYESGDAHCNLCFRTFPVERFLEHLQSAHFPQSQFTCERCSAHFGSSKSLHDHYNSQHVVNTDERIDFLRCRFNDVFTNRRDVTRHVRNSPDWIKRALSSNSNGARAKKEMRSALLDSYNANILTDFDWRAGNLCEFCYRLEATVCYYCVATFSDTCHLKEHMLSAHLLLSDELKAVVKFCDVCCLVFQRDNQLRKHRRREHEEMKKTTPNGCCFCDKIFANASNVRRHTINVHADLLGTPPDNSKVLFTCDHCKCQFSNKSNIRRHIERLHVKEKETRKSISCFHCEQRFNSIRNLNSHLTVEHQIRIQENQMMFPNLDGFWEWKHDEELRTNARYIQLRGLRRQQRKGEEISTLKFVCNRSGIFHSKSNGKRADRIKGSSKIGRYCSAYIEVAVTNSVVECTYCSTHSGHENDLRYLALTMKEKKEFYEKIKNGASFSSILNEIRDSVGKEIKRKHLVTNKDLHNIVTTFRNLTKPSDTTTFDERLNSDSPECAVTNNSAVGTETQNSPRIERHNYNHDLEISADLWVETCQRLVNQFDPSSDSGALSKAQEAPHTDVFDKSDNTIYTVSACTLDGASVSFPMSTYPRNEESSVQFYTSQPVEERYPRGDLHDYCVQDTPVDSCTNAFSATNIVRSSIDNVVCDNLPDTTDCADSCIEIPDDNVGTCGDSEQFDETDTGVSDLRDRVNSVTALYNIVESELDEHKKKLIRYYVDSMFRVLQYRNSKCKPKKRNTTRRPRQRPSVTSKHLNRWGRSGRMKSAGRKKALGVSRSRGTTTPRTSSTNSPSKFAIASTVANVMPPLAKNITALHSFQFF